MLDFPLESAFVAVISAASVTAGLHFYTSHSTDDRHTPSLTVESRSSSLASSPTIFRSELTLVIESEAHDTEPVDHNAIVEDVRAAISDNAAVAAAMTLVKLYGYSFANSVITVEGTRFRTALSFHVGYGAPLS